MAISNLLQFNPKSLGIMPTPSSFGMKTSTPSGAPTAPLNFTQSSATPKTQGTAGLASPTASPAINQGLTSTQPTAQYSAPVATPPTPMQSTQQPQGLFPSVVASLANRGTTPNQPAIDYTAQTAGYGAQNAATGQQAIDIASQFGQQYADVGQAGAKFRAGQLTTGTTPVAEGNAAVTAQSTAAQQTALAQGEQAALQGIGYQQSGLTNAATASNQAAGQAYTGQGLQQTALTSAGGLVQPGLAGYNQQVFNPATGQMSSGQSGGGTSGTAVAQLPSQGQSAVTSYAQQVQNGSMTRGDAESRLSAYGQPGLNALNEALGSGFNTNASNASAGTTAQGQQIQTAAASTNAALDTLGSAFANLNPAQTAGIPASNAIANWIGQQLGDKALTLFKTNLADARSQLIGVLNSSGGTPTGNEATANQYLPDNMTKSQFDSNVGTAQNPGIVRQLVDQKVKAFTGSGQQTNTNQNASSNSNIYSW